MNKIRSDPKRLHRRVELPTQHQQVFTLAPSLANAQQIVLTQLVNPLAVIANLTDRAALLRRHIGPDEPLGPYADRLTAPVLADQPLRGYLTGSIDVVLRVAGADGVPRDLVVDCIRLSAYAPNASNGQEWKWVIVDDPELRRKVGEQYCKMTVPPVSKMLESKLAMGSTVIFQREHDGSCMNTLTDMPFYLVVNNISDSLADGAER